MIRRILNSRLPLMVYNPVKVFDVKYFKEISSAGALPVFDTEFLTHDDILQNAALLSREKFSFGIRLSTHDHELINKIRNGTLKGKRKTKRKLVVPNIILYLEQSGEFADPQMLQIMLGIVGVLANMCSVAYVDRKLLYRYTCLSLLCFSYLFNSLPGTGGCTKNYAWILRH